MSSLRNKLEADRIAALEAQQKGRPALPPIKPDQPVQRRTFTHQDAEDAKIEAEAPRGTDARSRLGQPILLPPPDPEAVTVTMDMRFFRSQQEEKARLRQLWIDQDRQKVAQAAEAERQKAVAAAEKERLRIAGLEFERQIQSLEIQEITGSLTLAEYVAVAALVQQRYPSSVTEPSAWHLCIAEFREPKDFPLARARFDKLPLNIIETKSNFELSNVLECPPSFVQKLRDELRG